MATADETIKNLVNTITPNQRTMLKQTFDVMDGNPGYHGMGMFARLLQEYPEYKQLWPRFRHIHDSVLFTTGEMTTFAQIYMNELRNIVHSLEDDEVFIPTLEAVAAIHKKKGVETKHLNHMLPMLIATMRNAGATIGEEEEKAWAQVFSVIAEVIEVMKKQHRVKRQ